MEFREITSKKGKSQHGYTRTLYDTPFRVVLQYAKHSKELTTV